MDVAQPRDDQLLGLLHALDVKSRVFFGKAREAARDLLLVAASLGGDREAVRGGGQVKGRKWAAVLCRPQGVPRKRVRQLGHGADVAGVDLGRRHVLLAARVEDLGQALVAAAVEVRQVLIRLDRARDDLEVADLPELVAAGAEHERLGRLVGLALSGGQQLGDRRHQRPHAEQLGGR